MVTTMIMQRMSVAMEYGVILKWLKKEGDPVKAGEPVVEIFGEKNEFELEAPADGVLDQNIEGFFQSVETIVPCGKDQQFAEESVVDRSGGVEGGFIHERLLCIWL
ncbi:MAG: biotin/lipoyl-containing protein [Candidatus Thorarchaeota archaeon]